MANLHSCSSIYLCPTRTCSDSGVESIRSVIDAVSSPSRLGSERVAYILGLNILLRAAASFSVKKLQGIVDDLKEDANRMDRLVPIVEGRMARGEREDTERERVEAGLERLENKQERKEASAWRKQQQSDRVRSWLGGQALNESNSRRHYNNTVSRFGKTCDWLSGTSIFEEWANRTSKQPVVWLYAGPGSGKSILCSHAVDQVKSLEVKPAVAFQFYDFDDQQRTALQTARNLAAQLFEHFWLRYRDLPETLHALTQRNASDLVNVLELIQLLVCDLPVVYIFLDGLDEECTAARWNEASKIVDFVIGLADSSPSTVRVWCSTQDRPCIRERLETFPTLNIRDHVQTEVDIYLSQTVPGLDNMEVGDETRNWILGELKTRACGNFLWANLMIKTLKEEVACFDDMEQFIKDGLPKDLNEYYKRIFSRYEMKERDLARYAPSARSIPGYRKLINLQQNICAGRLFQATSSVQRTTRSNRYGVNYNSTSVEGPQHSLETIGSQTLRTTDRDTTRHRGF